MSAAAFHLPADWEPLVSRCINPQVRAMRIDNHASPARVSAAELEGRLRMIRVLIVDDNSFLREALASLLHSVDSIAVVGECADGAEVLRAATEARPDVVLMDVDMPITPGLKATRQLIAAQPAARVVILTGSSLATPREAAEAGAVGYLRKGGSSELLVEAIRTVAGGGTAWPTGATSLETVRATSG